MKCKSKLYSYVLMPLLCLFLVFTTFTMPTYASTTSGSEEGNLFERTEDYVRDNFNRLCRYVVRWNAVISDGIIGTWQDFTTWLENNDHGDIWTQHPHSPIRVQDGVENVEVPQEVLNVINQYVIYQIQQNPLTYSQCYIYSYNMVNVQQFPTYALYSTFKEWASKQDGYILTNAWIGNGTTQGIYACVIPKRSGVDFVGTTTAGGFTNVMMYVDWTARNTPWQYVSGSKWVKIANNGTISDFNGVGQMANTLGNTSSFNSGVSARMTIFSNLPKNEMVYVFNTLNALKAFNSGAPQPYYLTSEGYGTSMSNWQVGSGTINTGTLSSANSTYSNVVNNVQSGWTADQVLALVDKIVSSGNGGSGSSDDDDKSNLWEKIGNAIGNLIDGIVDVIASVIEKLTDAILSVIHLLTGYTDDGGVYHEGLLGKLTSLISVDFNNFLGSVFDWLPPGIVTLFTATLVFAVFFAIWKMIRG